MSYEHYAIAGLGRADVMHANTMDAKLLVQLGKYYLPARAGVGRAGLMPAGSDDRGACLAQVDALDISQSGAGEVPECTFKIVSTVAQAPRDGDPVVIAVGTLQTPIFGGYLVNPSIDYLSPSRQTYSCRALGWSHDLRKRIVSGRWECVRAGAIVSELIAAYTPHLRTAGFVQPGVMLSEFVAEDETLLEVCTRLAERCGFRLYVDALRNLHFHPPSTMSAAWNVAEGEHFGQLTLSEDSGQLCNRVIVRYSQVQPATDSFTGDGEQKDFTLSFIPHAITSLKVNDTLIDPAEYGERAVDETGSQQFSIDTGRGVVSTRDHAVLESTDTLTVAYTAKVPSKLTVNHAASQRARRDKEGSEGIYEFVIVDRDGILSQADARAAAVAHLDRYAWPLVQGGYVRVAGLTEILTGRLQPGMQQTLAYWGRNETLEVGRVTLSVLVPAADYHLKWLQSADLGEPAPRLDTLIAGQQSSVEPQTDIINDEESY